MNARIVVLAIAVVAACGDDASHSDVASAPDATAPDASADAASSFDASAEDGRGAVDSANADSADSDAAVASPALADLWDGTATFANEEPVCAKLPDGGVDGPVNVAWDFHYDLHDSGMAVIEWPENSGHVYYFAEHRRAGHPSVETLEPHLYRSLDGGKNFAHVTALFELDGQYEPSGACKLATTPYWDFGGKKYCLFQLREPDVMRWNGKPYVAYEAAARASDGEILTGIAVAALDDLDALSAPVQVQIGTNFRQHPLLLGNYVGDADGGTVSTSTPVWHGADAGIHVFWSGVSPSNGTWDRVTIYRGHYTNVPGSAQSDCFSPMPCFFAVDEHLIASPNFGLGDAGAFDSKNVDAKNVVTEGAWSYLLYLGGVQPVPNTGVGIARSAGLTNWERKYGADASAPVFTPLTPGGDALIYAKAARVSGEWFLYYYDTRKLYDEPSAIARTYRRRLIWGTSPGAFTSERCY